VSDVTDIDNLRAAVAVDTDVLKSRAASLALEQSEEDDENLESVLLFSLGAETYGVRIPHVREIYNEYAITPIPCVPEHVAGVINIRGEIVSVTDLKAMMGMGASEMFVAQGDEQAPVIVVSEGEMCTALIVDAIGDIVDVPAESVEPPLSVADKVQSEYVSGGFYLGGRLVALVNTTKILTPIGASD
jgi:purine-binding chemotaxis protein CheW